MTRPVPKNSNPKKRRVQYGVVPNGSRGFIVTTTRPIRIHSAMKEVVKLIKDIVASDSSMQDGESSAVTEGQDVSNSTEVKDFDAELAAEIAAESRGQKDYTTTEVCRGVGFIQVPPELTPSILCTRVCERIKNNQNIIIRDANRIIPLDCVISPPVFQSFVDHDLIIRYIVDKFQNSNAAGIRFEGSWRCELHRRNNTLSSKLLWYDLAHAASLGAAVEEIRDACIKDEKLDTCPHLAELIHRVEDVRSLSNKYKINLDAPQHVLFMEINPILIGCSIGERFDELNRYNLLSINNPE